MKRLILAVLLSALVSHAHASPNRENSGVRDRDNQPRNEEMYDNYGNRMGRVDGKGVMYDNYGNRMGRIDKDGTMYDNYGNRVMQIRKR